ncbi:MAG TPA: CBS domain-containing protein [Gaiellaceae bacterium]|nr:CBS domain-containing protein [Gaiellaceae bacterium]
MHGPRTTVAELRAFFGDDHVHIALLADGARLLGTVERADLAPALGGEVPALAVAKLEGRTIGPHTSLCRTLEQMRREGRRRLAVVDDESKLLGLLCLKRSGVGFCSDTDVGRRGRRRHGGPALLGALRSLVRPRAPETR